MGQRGGAPQQVPIGEPGVPLVAVPGLAVKVAFECPDAKTLTTVVFTQRTLGITMPRAMPIVVSRVTPAGHAVGVRPRMTLRPFNGQDASKADSYDSSVACVLLLPEVRAAHRDAGPTEHPDPASVLVGPENAPHQLHAVAPEVPSDHVNVEPGAGLSSTPPS